jgi:hypothetical protein
MDTDGNGFFSSWNGWNDRLKTQEFKDEFDEVINSLREEEIFSTTAKPLPVLLFKPTGTNGYGYGVLRRPS